MGIFFLVITINFTSLTAVFLYVSLGGNIFLSASIVLFHHSMFHDVWFHFPRWFGFWVGAFEFDLAEPAEALQKTLVEGFFFVLFCFATSCHVMQNVFTLTCTHSANCRY
jgi:hypothetical protein